MRFLRNTLAAIAVVAGSHFSGLACSSWLNTIDEANNPSDDSALSRCREVGRATMHDSGDGDKAWKAYYDCTVDAGLR